MENPYDRNSERFLPVIKHEAWEEGDANGYARGKAEQAEIVSGLVEAINVTLTSWDITNGDGISAEAPALMEQAIAKSTGI